MADSSKRITLSGAAAEDFQKHKGQIRRRGRGTRKAQRGGDEPPGPQLIAKVGGGPADLAPVQQSMPGTTPQDATKLGTPAVAAALATGTAPTPPAAPLVETTSTLTSSTPTTNPSNTVSKGGGKVILEPKKHAKGRLHLAPPTSPTARKSGTRSVPGKPSHTRKIKVNMSNMKKRMTTQKVIHKDSKEKSIEEIRKLLEEAKLVKPAREGKKVPEDILRNIYRDYLILRNKAL